MLEKMAEAEAISSNLAQNPIAGSNPPAVKKKRNLPGTPDPEAEVIALSPKTLMATNRFLCEICGKGFQRDQNLQLHRRGHNLPWKLKQRTTKEPRKRVYVCPEKTCVHHHPSRALSDLTGIKKHFCRKHGEKKWKCEKCSKRYAVQSDWKAHSKTCGTREYKCDCGTLFSRRDSFITHRAFCDALAEETARVNAATHLNSLATGNLNYHLMAGAQLVPGMAQHFSTIFKPISGNVDSMEQTRHGLSLWMSQGSQALETITNNVQEINQIGSASSGSIFGTGVDPLVPCSNPPPSDYQLNWVFGNKLINPSTATHEELTSSTTSLPLSSVNSNKEGTGSQTVNVPSLYTNQHQSISHHTHSMSATALLQKAAQMGATSTDPIFLGSFGLKCSNSQGQKSNKHCGLMYGSNPTDHHLDQNSTNNDDISTWNQLQMYPAAKRRHTLSTHDQDQVAAGGGETRDFLGVGVQPAICHPPSINGWT